MKSRCLGFAFALIGVSAFVGCTLTKSSLRNAQFKDVAGLAGPVLQPKRSLMTFAILTRPARDAAIDQTIWSVADEQVVPNDLRASLQANGFRVGVVTGDLPVEVEKMLSTRAPTESIRTRSKPPTAASLRWLLLPSPRKQACFSQSSMQLREEHMSRFRVS